MSQPIRILAVDVGTGTQDILLFESGKTIENCFGVPTGTTAFAPRSTSNTWPRPVRSVFK
ncbi:MAG: hypothetical protein NVSMB49_14510 [Ktedonobacteraceae bacterium]